MLRQLTNWRHYGRLRTLARTERTRKPHFLKQNAGLEIQDLLSFVVAQHARPDAEFFFVQIGAFDGRQQDPLFELVRERNWRGVLVEPQAEAFEVLKRNYQSQEGLQFFNVAIGPRDGEMTFFTRQDGLASIASPYRHLLVKPGLFRQEEVVQRQVPCWTLATLLERANAPDQIDLLQIDTEGFDYEIVRSIDFGRIAPAIIRYEHQILSEPDRNSCLRLLAENGYRFLLEDCDTTAIRVDDFCSKSSG